MRVFNSHLVSSDIRDSGNQFAVPTQQTPTYIASGTLSASFSTPSVNLSHIYGYSVTAITSGSVTGSLAIYASNDSGTDFNGTGVVNWTLVTDPVSGVSTLQGMTGSSNVTWNLSQQFYKWCRMTWSHTAGTGSIDIFASGKGNAT
jgi:hypothetical protein